MASRSTKAQTARPLSDAEILELDYQLCKADPLYWLKNHAWVRNDRTGQVFGPGLDLWQGVRGYPGQQEFALEVIAGHWVVTGKARQLGVSWLLRCLECYDLMFEDYARDAIIAQGDQQSKDHLLRVQWVYEQQRTHSPHLVRKFPIPRYMNTQRFGLANPDGTGLSVVEAHPSTSSAVRGISAKRISAEEFAFWKNSREVWPAIIGATADSGGQVIVATTSDSSDDQINDHYTELWDQAERGKNGFKAMFFPYDTHPARDEEWWEKTALEMADMPRMLQEFPRSPAEMFRASGSRYFDQALLTHLMSMLLADGLPAKREPLETRENGAWRIYEKYVPGRQYVFAADVSDGGGDACSADILDVETGRQVACLHSYDWTADEYADHLNELGRLYGFPLLAVERNGVGTATLGILQRVHHYPRLYRQQHWDTAKAQMVPVVGWVTGDTSRSLIFGGLKKAFSQMQIRVHDTATWSELMTIINHPRKRRPDAPDGKHDDRVISLGIAWQLRLQALQAGERQDIEFYLGDAKIG